MGNVSTLTINDGQATPVAQSFAPRSVDVNLVEYARTDGASLAANPVITVSRRLPSASTPNYKSVLRVKVPVMSTPVGDEPAEVLYTALANVEFVFPGHADSDVVSDLKAYTTNAMLNADVTAALKATDFPY